MYEMRKSPTSQKEIQLTETKMADFKVPPAPSRKTPRMNLATPNHATPQEIIDAHEALDCLTYLAESFALSVSGDRDDIKKLQQTTLAALPTKPQPTMADIEWNDDEHYLAEAEDESCSSVIMLQQSKETGNIQAILKGTIKSYLIYQRPEHLTPTGKRYTLTEIQE